MSWKRGFTTSMRAGSTKNPRATRLAAAARVAAVDLEVLADRPPHAVEHARRAGEVQAGEIGALERGITHRAPGARDEVDDPGRQAGRLFTGWALSVANHGLEFLPAE